MAQLHHPEFGRGLYYVKHYLAGITHSKGLPNEVCGYILARAAKLPVADHPLIVQVPRERIAEMHPAIAGRLRDNVVLAWATADVGGQPLPKDPELSGEQLRKWGLLPDLIAFDSWVVIPDRSADNLARRRNRHIVVIDHGHLGGSVYWTADLLPHLDERGHPFLSRLWVGQIPDEVMQRIVVAAERHTDCFQDAEPEVNRWMGPLLDEAGDRIALLQFLKERAKDSPARMKRVLKLLT